MSFRPSKADSRARKVFKSSAALSVDWCAVMTKGSLEKTDGVERVGAPGWRASIGAKWHWPLPEECEEE